MKRVKNITQEDRYFYNIMTGLICMALVLTTSIALLITYLARNGTDKTHHAEYNETLKYNNIYFSDRILPGITVSGHDVGGMTKSEAKQYLSGNVDYNIKTQQLILKYADKTWLASRDILNLTVDIDKAVELAYEKGRKGTLEERQAVYDAFEKGEKIDVSATVIEDYQPLLTLLKNIKNEIDIKMQDATVSVKFKNDKPTFTYTDEFEGRSLDINKVLLDISALVSKDSEVIEYTLTPQTVSPTVKRSDIEKKYSLVGSYTTHLFTVDSEGRIQNITRALEALDERVWMPGQIFSFNQWVGERTIENGFGLGVFINEDQQYDETIGGGICQVSTTIYNCALVSGANSVGRNAPIEIIERRPHTWPSSYVPVGIDATVSWPSTDLKLYNNNTSPYFIHTSIVKSGEVMFVTVQFYGIPLEKTKITIETEILEEIDPGETEYIVDTENKYNLQPGEQKVVSEKHIGYTVNVYQIWQQQGKESVKSLITVSKYPAIRGKIYVADEASIPTISTPEEPSLAPEE